MNNEAEYLEYAPVAQDKLTAVVPSLTPEGDKHLAMFLNSAAPPSTMHHLGGTLEGDLHSPATIAELAEEADRAKAWAEAGWVRRDPICREQIFSRPLANTDVRTHMRVNLTIWVDTSGNPAQGDMSVAVSEEKKATEERPFADDFKTLDIQQVFWTDPNSKYFGRRLDDLFAPGGRLMCDDSLWGNRKTYSRNLQRRALKKMCVEAYGSFVNEFVPTHKSLRAI
jgi:hypothetical protein